MRRYPPYLFQTDWTKSASLKSFFLSQPRPQASALVEVSPEAAEERLAMLALSLALVTALICAFCVWKALQEPKVLSIVTISAKPVAPKERQ